MQIIPAQANIIIVLSAFIVSIFILSKSADILVDNSVSLSSIWGLSEMIVGATVVSLGTTLPELSSSIISTMEGVEGFALGNAVGSTITNTSFVLGLSALSGSIPVAKESSRKLGILTFAVLLLIIASLPSKFGNESGLLPRWMGYIFVLMAMLYLYVMIRLQKKKDSAAMIHMPDPKTGRSGIKRLPGCCSKSLYRHWRSLSAPLFWSIRRRL
jgi:cation:H+ antiporter